MSDTCNWIDDAYGTHQPFLETYVRSTSGDVLDFGVFSTALETLLTSITQNPFCLALIF